MFVWGALAGGCASHQPKPVPMTPAAEKVLAELRADAESLLGEETPPHARPNLAWSLKISSVFLALWLALVLTVGSWWAGG